MKRLQFALLASVIYATALGSADPLDWLLGLAFGLLLPTPLHRPLRLRAVPGLLGFAAALVPMVLGGCLRLMRLLLRRRPPTTSTELTVYLPRLPRPGADLLAFAITSAPGTALVHYRATDRCLLFNVVDDRPARAVARDLEHFYRRHQAPLSRMRENDHDPLAE